MAPENKKRKGATDPAPKPKKQKKSDDTTAANKATAKTLKSAVNPVDDIALPAKVTRAPRKKAEDLFDQVPARNEGAKGKKGKKRGKAAIEANGDTDAVATDEKPAKKAKKAKAASIGAVPEPEVAVDAVPENTSKPKRSKKAEQRREPDAGEAEAPVATEVKKSKKSRTPKKQQVAQGSSPEAVEEAEADQDGEGEDEDDQTAALLAGFESEEDVSDLEKEDDGFDLKKLEGKVPKGLLKKLEGVSGDKEDVGVLFVGRIPHGFYEPQMKSYFSQFGTVNKTRLSRNKKTGASKHYAFVEFASAEVAEIVAKTMDKYLMFGHILQVKVIPPEQVHPNLFDGANKRFKVIPRNKMAASAQARGATRDVWEKRVDREQKRRSKKAKQLKEDFGYEFNLPPLRTVDSVPRKAVALSDASAQQLLDETPAEEVAATVHTTESTPGQLTITETVKVKKPKKGVKAKAEVMVDIEEVADVPEKNALKKRKSDVATAEESVEPVVKDKKARKSKKASRVSE